MEEIKNLFEFLPGKIHRRRGGIESFQASMKEAGREEYTLIYETANQPIWLKKTSK
jgi:hypothetical protein